MYISQIVAEIDRLRAQINNVAICELASKLNGGKQCSIEHSSKVGPGALMGSANYHARIRFHDGSPSWLMRVPRVASHAVGLPESLVEYLIQSEYATLKFLEKTSLPAPRAYSYGIRGTGSDHGVGVSFLLMEELPGKPWTGEGVSGEEATEEEKSKIWKGLADIMAELANHPFSQAGSLLFEQGNIKVSAVASDRFVVLDPNGPFTQAIDYYIAFAEQYLNLIADGQLYTEYPTNAYLVYRFMKENASQMAPKDAEQFFLKHVDDKGDHLLVDKDLNITGIIDWQMARVVPRAEAFGPSLVTANMRCLCSGEISITEGDLALAAYLKSNGVEKADECMINEKVRRFFWGLALEPKWSYALPLANAILAMFGVQCGWEEWKKSALKDYSNDERLRALLRAEEHGN